MPSHQALLARTLRLSKYAARVASARPAVVDELQARNATAFERADMRAALAGGADGLAQRLRRLRERVMLTLAYRDLNGLAPLDEVFATMTALAEESIAAAAAVADPELTVVALGKLGGGELNVSSDIDLVFVHSGDGVDHDRFSRAGQKLIALLSEITEDGPAFRVDMRLRPFGVSGPLHSSLAQLENYFVTQARPWERYAWMKARVVAGPAEGLAERVEPFVYRRYLDYGMLDALREMHSRIAEAALRRGKADDIKVGAGGIREIEFAVQLHQMIRGGRDPALRTPSTRAALAVLAERGLVDRERAQRLRAAYDFLRRLEHRLQYYDDQQTQALPREPEHQALIAEAMDAPDWPALAAKIEGERDFVKQHFESLFESQAPRTASTKIAASLNDPQGAADDEGLAADLAEAGIVDAAAVARAFLQFTRSRRYSGLSGPIRAKLEKLLPALIDAIAREGGRDVTATRLLALVEAVDRREAYYSLLLEFPQVLRRAAHLATRSAWAARLLARHPILLDELTRDAANVAAIDWKAERASLASEGAALAADTERLLDHLRHFKQRHMLRLTIADVEGEIAVMALSDELSALADTILDVVIELAAGQALEGFAIAAYGKLGGKELGYGSDLDIIFLYDETLSVPAEGTGRLAQKIISWLTSLTSAGILYETDLRLRPDGAKGLLVSSLAAFRDYELKRAWTWEHQALTRARFVAGDPVLGKRFEQVRDEVLAQPRDRAKLFAEILAMRARMRAEHRAERDDIKHIAGGVIDLEFSVQALVLAHGPEHPGLRENKGNHTLLKRAGDLGLIEKDIAGDAADAYLALRKRQHEGALNDEEKVKLAPGELERERAAVRRLESRLFSPAST